MTAVKFESMDFAHVVSEQAFERAGEGIPRVAFHRARSIPATDLPFDRRSRKKWTALSILLHILLVWVLLVPAPLTNLNPNLTLMEPGGGGPGPAGGGGGGTRGTGGVKYVQVAAPPQAATPPQVAPVAPPVEPVVKPPEPVLPEPTMPQLELPKAAATDVKVDVAVQSPIIGAGGGSGNDGTRGNGPGSGGGVGSGIGIGRGSGTGPGTGGGNLDHYPCVPIEFWLPPLPAPANVKGFRFIANFDVDERGNVLKIEFTPSRNGGYNRRLNDVLKGLRFRPGTTLEGVPRRTTCQISYEF